MKEQEIDRGGEMEDGARRRSLFGRLAGAAALGLAGLLPAASGSAAAAAAGGGTGRARERGGDVIANWSMGPRSTAGIRSRSRTISCRRMRLARQPPWLFSARARSRWP